MEQRAFAAGIVPSGRAGDRPASSTNGWIVMSGLAGFLLSLALMRGAELHPVYRCFVALASAVFPIISLDVVALRVHRRASTGLVWHVSPSSSQALDRPFERVRIKLFGFAGTLALIGASYWLFPVYHDRLYQPFWAALRDVVPWLVIIAPP